MSSCEHAELLPRKSHHSCCKCADEYMNKMRDALTLYQQQLVDSGNRHLIPLCSSGAHFLGNCYCEGLNVV